MHYGSKNVRSVAYNRRLKSGIEKMERLAKSLEEAEAAIPHRNSIGISRRKDMLRRNKHESYRSRMTISNNNLKSSLKRRSPKNGQADQSEKETTRGRKTRRERNRMFSSRRYQLHMNSSYQKPSKVGTDKKFHPQKLAKEFNRLKSLLGSIHIQRIYRGYLARKHTQILRDAIKKIQRLPRRWLTEKKMFKKHSSVILIQHQFRTYFRRKCKQYWVCQNCNDSRIQVKCIACNLFFCYSCFFTFPAHLDNTMHEFEDLSDKFCDVPLRPLEVVRAYRKKHAQNNYAARRLQAQQRGRCVRRNIKRNQNAARYLQAQQRGRCVRQNMKRNQNTARYLQAQQRGRRVRQNMKRNQNAAKCLQAQQRGRRVRQNMKRNQNAAKCLQAQQRGRRVRQNMKRNENAAKCLQAQQRGIHVRQNIKKKQKVALKVQSICRGWLVRRCITLAVIKVHQRRLTEISQTLLKFKKPSDRLIRISLRSERERRGKAIEKLQNRLLKDKERLDRAAIILQCTFRSKKSVGVVQKLRKERKIQEAASVIVQRNSRTFLLRRAKVQDAASIIVQRNSRIFLARRARRAKQQYKAQLNKAATTIQLLVRCYFCRKTLSKLKDRANRQKLLQEWGSKGMNIDEIVVLDKFIRSNLIPHKVFQILVKNDINVDLLKEVTEEELMKIGITLGSSKRLRNSIMDKNNHNYKINRKCNGTSVVSQKITPEKRIDKSSSYKLKLISKRQKEKMSNLIHTAEQLFFRRKSVKKADAAILRLVKAQKRKTMK